jgi:hypothetical protein
LSAYKDGVKADIVPEGPFLDLSNSDDPDAQLMLRCLAEGYEFSSSLFDVYQGTMRTIHEYYTAQK